MPRATSTERSPGAELLDWLKVCYAAASREWEDAHFLHSNHTWLGRSERKFAVQATAPHVAGYIEAQAGQRVCACIRRSK